MNNQQICTPQGIIDHNNESLFQEELLKFIDNTKEKDVVVDFKGVEFVDSSGLIALVRIYQEAKKQEKNLYLFNVSPSVRMIFEISRLDKVIGIRDKDYRQQLESDDSTDAGAPSVKAA
ncbi:STAS domain-containing protein [Cyanobacterium aponinum]|uniref:Anti-sigma factor antagonist n=1 Tax=Cyanobacterium aponinum (strain PCC 10605) TaxID=755178 RepID=K9YZG0_CYAAP|nr:STAS domain-containing protein [Cyanobacterium aponinum]AFZ52299.1 anti-sigma-factor antagonist [Cyanobacterium aponinum PCC 10605]